MTTIISIIIAVIASSGFWTFLQWYMDHKKARHSTEREALLALLHDRLYTEMDKLIEEDHIPKNVYENLVYLYKPYVKLGGNGTCEKMFQDISKRELKS